MLQQGGISSSDFDNAVASINHGRVPANFEASGQTSGAVLHPRPELQQGDRSFSPGHGVGTMVHWKTSCPQKQIPEADGLTEDSEDDDEYRPFSPPPPRERLSYTRHQLGMLNGIYQEVKYPNSTQKHLIAKRVGIKREQVKIWFQNRRRKDVLTKIGKGTSKEDSSLTRPESLTSNSLASSRTNDSQASDMKAESTSSSVDSERQCISSAVSVTSSAPTSSPNIDEFDFDNQNSNVSTNIGGSCGVISSTSADVSSTPANPSALHLSATFSSNNLVSQTILKGMIAELNKFDNKNLKLKKGKKKRKKSKYSSQWAPAASPVALRKGERLFHNYDMVAPPNKVTPTAFLNTSANKFKHAVGASAFENPRENRLQTTHSDSRLWEGFAVNQSASTLMDTPDCIQQRTSSNLVQQKSSSYLVQQRSSSDFVQLPFSSSMNFASSPHQPHSSNFHPGRDSVSLPHSLLPTSQSILFDNIPVLSDLLGSFTGHPSSATAIAAASAYAAAQRQQESSILPSVSSGQAHPGTNIRGVYFHHSKGSSNGISINAESSRSLDNSISFQHSTPLSLHHQSQASALGMNRVFPFPLVADPPIMLSSSSQSDAIRHTTQWHPSAPSIRSQTPLHNSSLASHSNSITAAASLSDDHYRPLVISSINNPYFTSASSTYALAPSSLPSQPQLWTMQSITGSEPERHFTQL